MATKKNLTLTIEPEIDFELIAISATTADYKICMALDEKFDLPFQFSETIEKKTQNVVAKFSVFSLVCDVRQTEICLINNKSEGNILVNDFRQADFILRLKGDWALQQKENLISFLKIINGVNAVMKPDAGTLKDVEWLTFELPDKEYFYHKQYVEGRKQQS